MPQSKRVLRLAQPAPPLDGRRCRPCVSPHNVMRHHPLTPPPKSAVSVDRHLIPHPTSLFPVATGNANDKHRPAALIRAAPAAMLPKMTPLTRRPYVASATRTRIPYRADSQSPPPAGQFGLALPQTTRGMARSWAQRATQGREPASEDCPPHLPTGVTAWRSARSVRVQLSLGRSQVISARTGSSRLSVCDVWLRAMAPVTSSRVSQIVSNR